jgi:hypothetical protein
LFEPHDLFDRLEASWYSGSTRFNANRPPRATEDEILAFEKSNRLRFPADLREYFLRFNGIDEDDRVFRFWQLEMLLPVNTENCNLVDAGRYFIFADYLIESNYYAIYLGENLLYQNRVVIPDYPNKPVIAPTFSSFLELYLLDDPRLYGIDCPTAR